MLEQMLDKRIWPRLRGIALVDSDAAPAASAVERDPSTGFGFSLAICSPVRHVMGWVGPPISDDQGLGTIRQSNAIPARITW